MFTPHFMGIEPIHLFKIDNIKDNPTDFQYQYQLSMGLMFPDESHKDKIITINKFSTIKATENCRLILLQKQQKQQKQHVVSTHKSPRFWRGLFLLSY